MDVVSGFYTTNLLLSGFDSKSLTSGCRLSFWPAAPPPAGMRNASPLTDVESPSLPTRSLVLLTAARIGTDALRINPLRTALSTLGMIIGILSVPLFLFSEGAAMLVLGAWMIGFFASGAWGIVPGYLAERFPTEARGVGTGFAYHVGVGLASQAPFLIGRLQDGGMDLSRAMAACIATAGVFVVVLLWLGPETRGRSLD